MNVLLSDRVAETRRQDALAEATRARLIASASRPASAVGLVARVYASARFALAVLASAAVRLIQN